MKRCSKCKQEKPRSDFHKRTKSKDGLNSWCKKCSIEDRIASYKKNPAQAKEYQRKRYKALRKRLFDYLVKQSCIDCGEDDPLVLEFDHVRGTKHSEVTTMVSRGNSWKKIQLEIDKCETRCANCHTRKTKLERSKSIKEFSENLAEFTGTNIQ